MPSRGVGQRVDLGRASAARAADGFAVRPLFPPAAERCALIVELSIETVPMIPVDPVSASNISNHALPAPSIEAIVDRCLGAVCRWTVAPARA
jgi:hypothetical protein